MRIRFEAFDTQGEIVSGELEATTVEEAHDLIRARGVTPYAVRTARSGGLLQGSGGSASRGKPFRDGDLVRPIRDIAVLLASRLPLEAALRIAASTSDAPQVRALALGLREGVLAGATLADTMERMQGRFAPEYIRMIRAGEMGASLALALQQLADLLDRRVEIRAKLRAAMAYPLLLVALAGVSLWVVLGMLIPAVTPMFLENGKSLPDVLWLLDAIRQNAGPVLAILSALGAIAGLAVVHGRRHPVTGRTIDRALLALPIVGRIAESREAARFTRTLAALIKAGVAPLQGLQAACPLVVNRHIRASLNDAVADVRAGASIGASLEKYPVLPAVAREMIAVGEQSGRLEEMLFRAATILEAQEQTLVSRTLSVLTPALTILVSGLVAAILMAVMSAVLSLNDLARQ